MPRMRPQIVRDRAVLGDSDTLDIDLRGFRGISAIDLIFRAANGATSNQGNPIHQDVDSIEVIDGSKVLYSLDGIQTRALNCYETKGYPHVQLDEQAAAVQEEMFTIHFGRYKGDEEYWLDPGMFANPTLRTTVSFNISATAGFATGTGTITVIVWTWDQAPASRAGMFLTKEYKSFTSAASGEDRTNLPADLPYRNIMLRAFETGIAIETDITQLKLTMDSDNDIVHDMRTAQLRQLNAQQFGAFNVAQTVFATDADVIDTLLGQVEGVSVQSILDLNVAGIDGIAVNNITLAVLSVTVAPAIAKETADIQTLVDARGFMPHHSLIIPFGDMDRPETWLQMGDAQRFEAILTQGGAGAAVSLFGQQVAP